MWKIKHRNKLLPFNSSNYLTFRNYNIKSIEEVYKLNFLSQNLSQKNLIKNRITSKLETKKKNNDLIQLNKSIERVKKFMPNLSHIINVTKTKKIEKQLMKRFENQETEKIMKNDLNEIINKKNKIKKSISDNYIKYQKIENKISDIKLSLEVNSKLENKPILITPNKKIKIKVDEQNLSQKNIKQMKMIQKKEQKEELKRKIKILNDRVNQKNKEISKMEKILPVMKVNKKEILSKLINLQKDKDDLKIIKDNLSEQLYFHYLNIIKEGIDTRNQGLSYAVKEILNLNKKVLLSYFPDYLDEESINYIIKQAKLKLELEEEGDLIKKIKNEFNKVNSLHKNKKEGKVKNKDIYENKINPEFNKILKENIKTPSNTRKNHMNRNKSDNFNLNMIMNDTFRFYSTGKTNFTNINSEKNFNSTDISDNRIKNENINISNNNINKVMEINKIKNNKTQLNIYPEIKTPKLIKDKNNLYKKIFAYNENVNLRFSKKKMNLSDLEFIPDKLSITQVNEFLKKKKKKITEKNIDKIWKYFDVKEKMKKIKNKLIENRKIEMKRIFKKYLKKEYSQKYISEKEKVLSALIGEDNVQPELKKQIKKTKLFFNSINDIGLMNQKSDNDNKINQISTIFFKKYI